MGDVDVREPVPGRGGPVSLCLQQLHDHIHRLRMPCGLSQWMMAAGERVGEGVVQCLLSVSRITASRSHNVTFPPDMCNGVLTGAGRGAQGVGAQLGGAASAFESSAAAAVVAGPGGTRRVSMLVTLCERG